MVGLGLARDVREVRVAQRVLLREGPIGRNGFQPVGLADAPAPPAA
jgi:hypothetical protein